MDEPSEAFKMLTAHLAEFRQDTPTCPICGNRDWAIHGPRNLMGYQPPPNEGTDLSSYTPMVLLLCTKCFFAYQFAWLAVQHLAKERAKTEESKIEEKAQDDHG